MASNFLSSYLSGVSFDKKHKPGEKKGLVVTISRQKGCSAFPISKMIVEKLNELRYPLGRVIKWNLVSKEILMDSAAKLKVNPAKMDALMDMDVVQEFLLNLSGKTLPSDIKIRNTIRNAIQNVAAKGNIIIIGRGGVTITREWENSLHIRLIAPVDWRVKQIAKYENLSLEKANKEVLERDRQREALRQYFFGVRKADMHLYDVTINVSTMEQDEVAEAIFRIIKTRQDELVLTKR